ncbi:hypothetical protein GCN74_26730 [Janthinobacterium sp. FT14W]|nr:hypothetical protein GCN74_26730 [Janthinobacterium sp. FT14W]
MVREMTNYIGRELSKGRTRAQIASNISKSAAFMTQHAVLLALPEPIGLAFNKGGGNLMPAPMLSVRWDCQPPV